MTQGQDPYGEPGEFTPYQPADAPQGESAAPPPPPVPYVPYGTAQGPSYGMPLIASPPRRRWLGWVVGIGVLLMTCGGGLTGLVGAFIGDDDSTSGSGPDIEVPAIEIPSLDIPSPVVPTVVFANDLQRGQCLNGAGFDPTTNDPLTNIQVVDCAGAHDAQVLEVNVLDRREAEDYDFDDDSQVDVTCIRLFTPAQKALLEGDKYVLLAFTQTRTPATGDKAACILVRSDGGPLRGFLPKPEG